MVAVLWAEFGLAPSETLGAPEPVVQRAIRYLQERGEAQAKQHKQEQFEADAERMHQVLRSTGG